MAINVNAHIYICSSVVTRPAAANFEKLCPQNMLGGATSDPEGPFIEHIH